MKKFLSENRKTIVKLLLNRFGAIVFALMLSLATITLNGNAIFVAGSIVSILFFCYLIYLVIWERGASDRIRADGGRIEACPHLGLRLGIAAAFPGILLALLIVIGVIFGRVSGIPFFADIAGVCEIIARVWHAMYIGIIQTVTPAETTAWGAVLYSLLYFAVIIPEVFVTWLAYYLGYNGKLMSHVYKKGKKD